MRYKIHQYQIFNDDEDDHFCVCEKNCYTEIEISVDLVR